MSPEAREGSRARRRAEVRTRRLGAGAAVAIGVAVAASLALGGGASPGRATAARGSGTRGPQASAGASRPRQAGAARPTGVGFEPPRIRPIVAGRPGDGVWSAPEPWAPRPSPLLVTSFAFDRANPANVAYVAWIRSGAARLVLYPGWKNPGATSQPAGPEAVPPARRSTLLATFNSGFYERDAPGGFATGGRLYVPMSKGLATVVAYRDGRFDVVRWRGGPRPGRDVVMARQNLTPIVEGGKPSPSLDLSPRWGRTLGGSLLVWRTGLGVDAHGDLLYLAGPDLGAPGLARLLVHAGAVRAMELDINPEWPVFAVYGGRGAVAPRLFVPNPNQVADRFLTPSEKDFFALFEAPRQTAAHPGG